MATIELRDVEKIFGDNHAVKPMNLTIKDGEFICLLGPSGCGKTTTLRMISGLEAVTSGTILLDGRNVTWRHPSDRDIAFVFQLYALYPHMTVRDNISFPLRAEGMKREEIDIRIGEVVDILRIHHLLKYKPGKLSGGDQQRVALARALVRRPSAFLMDEPLGALDAELRETMRAEIKALHHAQNATTVYVTHDQIEAMALSDRIVVMSAAEVQQVGTPAEVYYEPANLFVARFIGSPGMNLIDGQLDGDLIRFPGNDSTMAVPAHFRVPLLAALDKGDDVVVGFRPEAAAISDDSTMAGEVYAVDMHGGYKLLHVNLGTATDPVIVHLRADRLASHPMGSSLRFTADPAMLRFFDPKTGRAISPSETAPVQTQPVEVTA
ncbi:MAG: ABC transporter ATP-binding protein [Caldilineae bacterium]|nr:ABC transporter ATP-binding protein [Anaerolineae bacterium]MCB9154705.1 ABC transporter ATP-binding protein [Caldilineae bacterium]